MAFRFVFELYMFSLNPVNDEATSNKLCNRAGSREASVTNDLR